MRHYSNKALIKYAIFLFLEIAVTGVMIYDIFEEWKTRTPPNAKYPTVPSCILLIYGGLSDVVILVAYFWIVTYSCWDLPHEYSKIQSESSNTKLYAKRTLFVGLFGIRLALFGLSTIYACKIFFFVLEKS